LARERTYRTVGETPALQDALAALIVAGQKRATTSLARWYGKGGAPWPIVGETWAVTDGQGRVRCRCRTTRVEIRAFCDVDAEHAAAEGEKDGSLERWREIHQAFSARQAARHHFVFDQATLVVLERFDVLEPS
jgi:uncharacterized protein YhfF